MTTSTRRKELIDKQQRLNDAADNAQRELQRVEQLRAEIAREIQAEDQTIAEAAVLAAKQGLPPDIARQRIERERGGKTPDNASDFRDRQSYLKWRQEKHGF